jgi:hypothetical protein
VEQLTEDIFRVSHRESQNPEAAQRTTARQVVDMGARLAASRVNDAPEAKLKMLDLLGSLYEGLEVSDQAVTIKRQQVVAQAMKLYGAESEKVVPLLIDVRGSSTLSPADREWIATFVSPGMIVFSARAPWRDGSLSPRWQ